MRDIYALLKSKRRTMKPAKRLNKRILLESVEDYDKLAEEEEMMSRYEHGQEVG